MPGDDRLKGKGKGPSPAAGKRAKAATRELESQDTSPAKVTPRLLERYREQAVPALVKDFSYRNPMEVPRLEKVVINIGLGEALENAKALEAAQRDLEAITGQHPVTTKARHSIAAFKLRSGMTIGMMVTLRSKRMYDFLDRLFNTALPRIRDFRGTARRSFDGRGNYSLGLTEQIIFPEIDYGQVDRMRGLQVNIVTSARTDQEGERLLELMGMPFEKV